MYLFSSKCCGFTDYFVILCYHSDLLRLNTMIQTPEMMTTGPKDESVAAVPSGVGDAVGVDNRKWFVAIVNNNTEKAVGERIAKLGFETYVATQTVYRTWRNGKRARIEQVLLPALVFVRCTERERRELVNRPYVNRFMTNKAADRGSSLTSPLAVIPQRQIDTLRFMLGQSDIPVTFVSRPYRVHDRIRVARGKLTGLEGEVVRTSEGKSELIVRIDILGCASVSIDTIDVEPLT